MQNSKQHNDPPEILEKNILLLRWLMSDESIWMLGFRVSKRNCRRHGGENHGVTRLLVKQSGRYPETGDIEREKNC